MIKLSRSKVVLIAVSVIVLMNLAQSLFSGEEGRIRKFIRQGERAVEERNLLKCLSLISEQYRDKYANDRQSALAIAKELFLYYKNIFIDIDNNKTEIKLNDRKTEAEVEIEALVLCENKGNVKEKIFEGEKGRLRLKLIKEENKWLLAEIEFYEPVSIMGEDII
jgi:hypothetical protein